MSLEHFVRSHLGDRRRAASFSDMRGVCLTELLISLAVGAIVLAATLEAVNMVQAHATTQHRMVTHQQDLRLGLEVFEQEVRLAVADSIVTAAPDAFLFLANLHGQRTLTTGAVVSGQSMLSVQNGSGWGDGKAVKICGQQACETHHLSRAGQRYQLILAEPIAVAFPVGASVEVSNHVTYYTKRDEQGMLRLMRMVDGGANTLIGELKDARFSYRDETGRTTVIPSKIRRVDIEIEAGHSSRSIVRTISLRT